MFFPTKPLEATFIERPNRFLGVVDLSGETVECFIPNPGRMHELLYPGSRVYLLNREGGKRRTGYDLVLVEDSGKLISVDSRIPNTVVREGILEGAFPMFHGLELERAEPPFRGSRLDFLLRGRGGKLILEVKSCTLVEGGVALFPDAPTLRGLRHIGNLRESLAEGRGALMFVIQRGDAPLFRPNRVTDGDFARALTSASEAGVEVYAYDCAVSLEGVLLNRPIPVDLSPDRDF
jgi:sugar fermentation stimulation protein A